MDKLAIITVYNNEELAEQMTETAAKASRGYSCQFITINNKNNNLYPSAAAAFNAVLDQMPDADVFVFCHQDIVFLNQSLYDIYSICMGEPLTLFGAAGVKNTGPHGGGKRIISSMALFKDGWNYKTLEKGTTEEVFTLDECLICASRSLFAQLKFDEETCNGWHLYAAELCMQCHVKGLCVKVFDADIVHLSGGSQDKSFYVCERKLVKKYRKTFPIISYTCGWAYTDPFRYACLKLYRRFRYGIK